MNDIDTDGEREPTNETVPPLEPATASIPAEPQEPATTSIPAEPQEPATTPVPVEPAVEAEPPVPVERAVEAEPPAPEEPAVEAEPPAPERERVFAGTGLVWGLILGVLLAVLIVVLIAQNTQSTTIEFLVWEYSTPLIVVILAALVVGVVFDELIGLVYRSRRRRTLSEREQLRRLQTTSES
jgi:uncharacterized integral membrane protein